MEDKILSRLVLMIANEELSLKESKDAIGGHILTSQRELLMRCLEEMPKKYTDASVCGEFNHAIDQCTSVLKEELEGLK